MGLSYRVLQAAVEEENEIKKQKSPGSPGLFVVWWRRRELNPRPPVLSLELYMFSVSLLI
jgi:hypothetical protein